MTIHEATIAKIQQMPEPLVQEVQDYIDALLRRGDAAHRENSEHVADAEILAEAGMADYLLELEEYEEKLARGEIKW